MRRVLAFALVIISILMAGLTAVGLSLLPHATGTWVPAAFLFVQVILWLARGALFQRTARTTFLSGAVLTLLFLVVMRAFPAAPSSPGAHPAGDSGALFLLVVAAGGAALSLACSCLAVLMHRLDPSEG